MKNYIGGVVLSALLALAITLVLPEPAQASNRIGSLLQDAAMRNGLPRSLVKAIAWKESNWRQWVVGPSGEIGVMQILPSTATALNRRAGTNYNVYSLTGNIALGVVYLRFLLRNFRGSLTKAISGYNAGEGSVARWGIRNWGYVNHVLALMQRL